MKRKLTLVIVGIICCLFMFGCGNKTDPQNAKISPMSGSFLYDVYSIPDRVSNADYIIVGKVLEETGATYQYPAVFTHYSVEVVENLKGELRKDKPILITKDGGVTKDGSECFLFGGDILPIENGTYIFFINAQQNGSNLSSGPNSTIPLDDNATQTKLTTRNSSEFDRLSYEKKTQAILDALAMNIPAVREHHVSDDDVSKQ